ncbi:uncharacterized protein Dwil_GK11615 [Drosophila willistoni]|uniref:EF-hand domain-containing protein n=1 Tax=Drosophila willistoni TaxID=7260 RepID=B4N9N6_DROWI|nr:calcium uptake protein 1 homolog, mitochondrial [Drosophila willistoni]EDW80601.1 uncharacterized protein Dwil_GK11615 [Drosophila willistoni]
MTRSWQTLFNYARHMHALLRQEREQRERCPQQIGHSRFSLLPTIHAYCTEEKVQQVKECSDRKKFKRSLMLVKWFYPLVKASDESDETDGINNEGRAKAEKKAKEKSRESIHRNSFRQMTIRSYENRLRRYSHPDKIFRYFATIKMKNEQGRWEIYMTPLDFLRSLMPGFLQPENLGLDRYRKIDSSKTLTYPGLSEDSFFCKFQSNGLLTYSDYVFLMCLIKMPERYIEMAFRLFDHDGDGNLSMDELNKMFEKVGFSDTHLRNAKVYRYFFGNNFNQKLSLNKFLQFQRHINRDILMMEFNLLMKNPPQMKNEGKLRTKQEKNMKITELAFAKVLLAYAGYPNKKRLLTLQRIKEKYSTSTTGISLNDFMAFFTFVRDISAIDAALTFHYLAGADISRETLKHISKVVVGVHLSDHLIDIIYTVFDSDENGILSRRELVHVFRDRKTRGRWVNHNSVKFTAILGAVCKCAQDTIRSYM